MKSKFIIIFILFFLVLPIHYVQAQSETQDYKNLIGRWVRPDGGYVLVIKDVNSDGSIEAAYFNPNPIDVSEAYITVKSDKTNIFVKLEGWGYEGSYYTLVYDKDTDRLIGVYHQLVYKQNYDIYFVRE